MTNSPVSIVMQVGYAIPPLLGLALVLYRLIPRLKYGKLTLKIPIVVLGLELLSHLLRLVLAIDPLGIRSLFDPFSALFWVTPHIAVSLICHLIVLFYWNRAMHSFGATRSIGFLQRYLYVLIAAIVLTELLSAIVRGLELSFAVLLAAQFFYIVVDLIVIVFILYTAVGIYRYLRNGHVSKQRVRAKIVKMTRLLVASAVLLIWFVVLSGLGLLPFFRVPYAEFALYLMVTFISSAIAICETLVLKPINAKTGDSVETDVTGKSTGMGSVSTSRASLSAVTPSSPTSEDIYETNSPNSNAEKRTASRSDSSTTAAEHM